MTGFDAFLVFLLVVAAGVETMRGFGMSVLDLLAVWAAFIVVALVAPHVATAMPGTTANYSEIYVASFVVLTILFLIGARLAYNLVLWDIGVFDKIGGTFIGFVLGVVFCHAVVSGLSSGDLQQTAAISGPVSQQLLTFSTFYQMNGDIHRLVAPKPDSD